MLKKIRVSPASTIKDSDGHVLGTAGDVIEVDGKLADDYIAGGSAELVESDAPRGSSKGRGRS